MANFALESKNHLIMSRKNILITILVLMASFLFMESAFAKGEKIKALVVSGDIF